MECCLEADKASCADPKDIVGACFGQECVHIFTLCLYAVIFAVRATEATAPAVWQVDREGISQSLGELRMAVG